MGFVPTGHRPIKSRHFYQAGDNIQKQRKRHFYVARRDPKCFIFDYSRE
jgi:hypothetical protein